MSLLEEHDTFIHLNWISFLGVFNFLKSCPQNIMLKYTKNTLYLFTMPA